MLNLYSHLFAKICMNIGVDIEEIENFSRNKYEEKKSFYEKIFLPNEIKYCLSKSNPYPHFTARFCAKEATKKALHNEKISFSDIEVRIKNKKPFLHLANKKKVMMSMAHTKNYAIAFVIIK